MAINKWATGDIITANLINKRGIRSGTTAEIDAEADGDVIVGSMFFDTTLGKPKMVSVVSPRAYEIMGPVGTHQIWIPASACYPALTDGCSAHIQSEFPTNDVDIITLDFSGGTPATDEIAKFDWVPPQNWDASDFTIKCKPYWTAGAGAGTVEFEFSAVSISNDDPMDAAFGSAIASLDTLLAADDLHISPQTTAITIAGSPAKLDWVQIKIKRDQANDTKPEDAKLLGFVLEYSIDLPNSTG